MLTNLWTLEMPQGPRVGDIQGVLKAFAFM